jgi:DNA primase
MYLKHAKQWGPNALRRVRIQEKTKVGEYLVADNIEALVSLAQMGIVEVHTGIPRMTTSSGRTALCGIWTQVLR